MRARVLLFFVATTLTVLEPATAPPSAFALTAQAGGEEYLTWTAAQAEATVMKMLVKGTVPGTRKTLNTEVAKRYKLRATWLTPDVIRSTARLIQLRERLTDQQTRALVAEAEAAGDTVVLIELDPIEGSGVVPVDRGAYLQPKGNTSPEKAATGMEKPGLEDIRAFKNVHPRDYSYDRLWMVFPLVNQQGAPLFSGGDLEAELSVRIRTKEASVSWPIPDSIRRPTAAPRK